MEIDDLDFSSPWDHSDITFILEGKKVHANKTILSMWSPVMQAMFRDDFKERKAAEIELPGKTHQDFMELMRVVHPPNKDIDDSNVCQLLPLTQEYQMTKVTERCENYLLSQPPSVKCLVLAENHDLQKLHDACILYAKETPLCQLQMQSGFDLIPDSTLVEILTYKVEKTEAPMRTIKAVTSWNKPHPNPKMWCPSVDDVTNRHRLGAKKGCTECNSYNFGQIERLCNKLKI